MESLRAWWESFQESLSSSMAGIAAYLPTLATAIAVMFAGWIVARLVRALLLRSGGALNSLLDRLHRASPGARHRVSQRLVTLIANFAFFCFFIGKYDFHL